MSERIKIAICVSGQTRGIADTSALVNSFALLKHSAEFDIDFFGHTWTDQVAPININDFRNFQHTDQDEIWHEFKGDIFNMIPFNSDWNQHPEYIKLLNGDGNFSEFAKDRVKGVFGQIVSNYKCIEQINTSEYVAIIKWRWDNILRNPAEFTKYLIDFVEYKNIHSDRLYERHNPMGVTNDMRIGTSPANTYIEDRFFLFRPSHVDQLVSGNVYQTLRNVYKIDARNDDTGRLHSHALWIAYFVENGIHMQPCFLCESQWDPILDYSLLNKEWSN